MLKKIEKATDYLRKKIDFKPQIGIILGTGLNQVARLIENPVIIPYDDIPGMVISTAPSHKGRLLAGFLDDKKVIILQGRFHYYEGYSMQEVTFPIRILKVMGIKQLILTNAAGSLNEEFQPGNLVLINDHINLMGDNPLRGENQEKLGERFPSMNEPYSNELMEICQNIAQENDFELKKGIYAGLAGPSLETRAECKMLVYLGADLVGMSTVPEVIVAIHSGMRVVGISVVTNLSNIFHSYPHNQEDIQKNAQKAIANLKILIKNLVKKI